MFLCGDFIIAVSIQQTLGNIQLMAVPFKSVVGGRNGRYLKNSTPPLPPPARNHIYSNGIKLIQNSAPPPFKKTFRSLPPPHFLNGTALIKKRVDRVVQLCDLPLNIFKKNGSVEGMIHCTNVTCAVLSPKQWRNQFFCS